MEWFLGIQAGFCNIQCKGDPLIWLYKCEQLFSNQRKLEEDKLQLATFHMLKEA